MKKLIFVLLCLPFFACDENIQVDNGHKPERKCIAYKEIPGEHYVHYCYDTENQLCYLEYGYAAQLVDTNICIKMFDKYAQ